jgi:hypothetical protein
LEILNHLLQSFNSHVWLFYYGTRVWTQGHQPFILGRVFWDTISGTMLGLTPNCNPLDLWVARIKGMSHLCPAPVFGFWGTQT